MQKRIALSCTLFLMFSHLALAAIPVITLSTGADRTNVYSATSITLLPPFQNFYQGTTHYDTEPTFGLFVGTEIPIHNDWAAQLGISFFESSPFIAHGIVYQFSDPAFNNLSYQYKILSQRYCFETKISRRFNDIWHPFVTAGAGIAWNKAYGYQESPLISAAIPMSPGFSSANYFSTIHSIGLGMDVDLMQHIRLGIAYRFLNLGNAQLGTSPLQSSTSVIRNRRLNTNEFLFQLSYVGGEPHE